MWFSLLLLYRRGYDDQQCVLLEEQLMLAQGADLDSVQACLMRDILKAEPMGAAIRAGDPEALAALGIEVAPGVTNPFANPEYQEYTILGILGAYRLDGEPRSGWELACATTPMSRTAAELLAARGHHDGAFDPAPPFLQGRKREARNRRLWREHPWYSAECAFWTSANGGQCVRRSILVRAHQPPRALELAEHDAATYGAARGLECLGVRDLYLVIDKLEHLCELRRRWSREAEHAVAARLADAVLRRS